MKKIILLLIMGMFTVNCANAQNFAWKNIFNHKKDKQMPVSSQLSSNTEMTKSEKATIYYSQNDIKNAFEVLLSIKEDERTAQDWILLGNILQDQEKISDAEFMYQRASIVDSKCYKAYYNLANMYLDEDKPYLAIETYNKAKKANPDFPYTYYNLGCAYLKIGNLKKAKYAFLAAVETKNTVADFHYNLAYTYKMLNKPKLAKQYLNNYNKLMEINAE